jgi:hypothetical protein
MDNTILIGILVESYKDAHEKNAPASDYGISRGQHGNGDGTTIYIEIKGETYSLGKNTLSDSMGDDFSKKIWDWIKS